jgi:hypothetical protein
MLHVSTMTGHNQVQINKQEGSGAPVAVIPVTRDLLHTSLWAAVTPVYQTQPGTP